jgi:hypothetical protein
MRKIISFEISLTLVRGHQFQCRLALPVRPVLRYYWQLLTLIHSYFTGIDKKISVKYLNEIN